jgi:hypothetical protein
MEPDGGPTPEPGPVAKYDILTGKRLDRQSRKPLVIVVVMALVAVALLGTLVLGGRGDKQTIVGTTRLTSFDDDIGGSGLEDCHGTGGYDDFDQGTDVKIRNEDGKLIGTGTLRNGTKTEIAEQLLINPTEDDTSADEMIELLDEFEDYTCILLFEAEVDDAKIYSVEVGNRGELTYSKDELEEHNWYVASTLGD